MFLFFLFFKKGIFIVKQRKRMKYLRGENSRSFGVKIDKDSIRNEAIGQIIII